MSSRALSLTAVLFVAACKAPSPPVACPGIDFTTSAANCGSCGHACPSGDMCMASVCVTPAPQPPQISVAFTSPADGAHVLQKFTVALAVTAPATASEVVLSLPSGESFELTPGASPSGLFDADDLPDGTFTLTATVREGGATATATRMLVMDRAQLAPTVTGAGYYGLAENVALHASTVAGIAIDHVAFAVDGAAAPAVTVTAPAADGTWDMSAPANTLGRGRGDVNVDVTAVDKLGNSATTTAAVTLGLLHGSAIPAVSTARNSQVAVTSPGGARGVLYVQMVAGNPGLGYAQLGGGKFTTIAANAMFTGPDERNFAVSADGSRALFVEAGAQPNTWQLMATSLPPTGAPKPLSGISTTSNFRPQLSIDGKVGAWMESTTNATGGTVVSWHGGAIDGTPVALTVLSGSPSGWQWYLLKGALIEVGSHPAIITASGAAALTLGSGANPKPVSITTQSGGVVSADGTALLIPAATPGGQEQWTTFTTQGGALICPAGATCKTVNRAVSLQGADFAYETGDGSSDPATSHIVAWADVATGAGKSVGPLTFADLGPFDGSATLLRATSGALTALASDGTTTAISTGTTGFAGGFLNSDAVNGCDQILSEVAYSRFDDPAHVVVVAGGLFVGKVGGSTVRLDSTSSPLRGDAVLTPDRAHFFFTTSGATSSDFWSYALDAAAPVHLAASATGFTLPTGASIDNSSQGRASAAQLRGSKVVAIAEPIAVAAGGTPVAARLYSVPLDGSSAAVQITKTDDTDAVDLAHGGPSYGVTSDDAFLWWVSVSSHLFVKPMAGAVIDFGSAVPGAVVMVAGGAALWSDSANAWHWATAAAPKAQTVGAAGDYLTGYGNDDGTAFYVQDSSLNSYPFFELTASGLAQVLGDSSNNFTTDASSGVVYGQGSDNSLAIANLRSGGGPAVVLETGFVYSNFKAEDNAMPVPGPAGFLPGRNGSRGAQPRELIDYTVSGTPRDGVYVWDIVDQVNNQQGC